MILRSLRCYCNKIALCFTRKFCTFLIFPLVLAMKKEIKVALIGGGVAIIVALITISGSLKPAEISFKTISPAIHNSQNVTGNTSTLYDSMSDFNYRASLAYRQLSHDSTMSAERQKYKNKLPEASYVFNTPNSVKIDNPFTIHFFLNPLDEPKKLEKKLRLIISHEPYGKNQKIEAKRTKWNTKMRVTLTGQDFEITPVEGNTFDGIKTPNSDEDTSWSWSVKAKHDGEALPLYLNIWCELPKELGGPLEMIPTLTRYIRIDVTPIWILNTYWEKWKWILGGIGTVLVTAFGLWWKSRHPESTKS